MKKTNPFIKGFLYFYTTYCMWKDIIRVNTSCYNEYFWYFLNGDAANIYNKRRMSIGASVVGYGYLTPLLDGTFKKEV